MSGRPKIDVLIPAWNEEASIPLVISDIPKEWVRQVIVCNNGSTDKTAKKALECGALVVEQPLRGYGNACLAGMGYLKNLPPSEQPEIVVFLDGDNSDFPEDLPDLIRPIIEQDADLVVGSRMLGHMEPGAMTLPQRFGNWLAPALIRLFWGYQFTDLGPFRAIKWDKLLALQMQDRNFGWTVEMQVKAAKMKMKCVEVPVRYRKRRLGESKVSGTIKGAFMAGTIILKTIFKAAITAD